MDKIQQDIKKRNAIGKTHNRVLYGFIFLFLIGYFLFFTSTLWLPKPYQGVEVIPIGSEVTFSDRTITLDSCRYSKEQGTMEIITHIENQSLDGINTYNWKVSAPNKLLKTETVINDADIVVIKVKNVPKNWTELSLTANLKEKDYNKQSQFQEIKVYINDKSAENVTSLPKLSKKEYLEIAANSKIKTFRAEIRRIEKEENELKQMIDNANKKIDEKTKEMKYQTESEKMATGEEISTLQSQKESITSQLSEKHQKLENYLKKIKLLQEYIKTL